MRPTVGIPLFAGLMLITLVCAASDVRQTENAARYDNYRLYRLHFTDDNQVRVFQELERISDSVIFYGHARAVGQRLTILVSAHKIADITELLQRFAVEHQILNHNFQDAIDSQLRAIAPKSTPGRQLDWQHYFHLDTIYDYLDALVADHPDWISPLNIGTSYDGRPLRGVKLSWPNPSGAHRTGVFVEAGIHAREWISPATSTFILHQLVHSRQPAVRALAASFDWYFLPVVNPDGYAFTFDSDRMWRKTRQPNGICLGADMNRNFESHWNQTGSCPDPCAYDFAGTAALSEPEAAAVARWLRANRQSAHIETFVSLHSFSQLMMFPHGHTAVKPSNYDDLLSIGRRAIRALRQRYGTVYQTGSIHEIIYPSSGGSMDWAYDGLGIPVAFTIELRGPPDSTVMFNLPADEIEPVGWETLDAFVALLNEAERLGYYEADRRTAAKDDLK